MATVVKTATVVATTVVFSSISDGKIDWGSFFSVSITILWSYCQSQIVNTLLLCARFVHVSMCVVEVNVCVEIFFLPLRLNYNTAESCVAKLCVCVCVHMMCGIEALCNKRVAELRNFELLKKKKWYIFTWCNSLTHIRAHWHAPRRNREQERATDIRTGTTVTYRTLRTHTQSNF